MNPYIREPFTGAWQRNIACNDPLLMTFSGVYACIEIISADVSKLGLYLFRRQDDGSRKLVTNHPIAFLLRHPNDYQTQLELMQCVMISTLATGNAYLLKRRDQRGVVNALYPLDPHSVWPKIAEDGSIFYSMGGDLRLAGGLPQGAQVVAPASEVIHHRINPIGHPLIGTSPLIAAALSSTVGLNIQANSAALFGNMSQPGGILSTDKLVSPELAERMRQEWKKNFGGQNLGNVAVLGNGLKFDAGTAMKAVDAQLIDQLRWTIEDVARVFRVPGFMLGDLNKVSYRNSEQLQRTYYSGCLQFHLEALESRLHEGLELDDATEIEFDLDNLLRTEIDVRFDAYQKAINAGFYCINDARRREDLAPVEGGDEPLVQAQYVPLSAAIAKAEADAANAANPPAPPASEAVPVEDAQTTEPDAAAAAKRLTEEIIAGLRLHVRATI